MIPAWWRNQKLRFLLVGGWNTAFGYLVFQGLYTLLGNRSNYLLIAVVAHLLAVANAFICHRFLTFRSTTPWLPALIRFTLAQGATLILGLAALALCVEVFQWGPRVSQTVVLLASLVLSYAVHRRFSFRSSDSD